MSTETEGGIIDPMEPVREFRRQSFDVLRVIMTHERLQVPVPSEVQGSYDRLVDLAEVEMQRVVQDRKLSA